MRVREVMQMEVEREERRSYAAGCRDGVGGRQPLAAGKVRESNSLPEPPERTSPAGPF